MENLDHFQCRARFRFRAELRSEDAYFRDHFRVRSLGEGAGWMDHCHVRDEVRSGRDFRDYFRDHYHFPGHCHVRDVGRDVDAGVARRNCFRNGDHVDPSAIQKSNSA